MRRQRFPFLIGPAPARAETEEGVTDRLSRILSSLSLVESSLEELLEKTDSDRAWRDFYAALIPVLDGIAALRDAVERDGDPGWRRGMEIVTGKLEALLTSRGLEPSACVGDVFDPSRHRAAGARRAEGVPPGAIAEIVEAGWTFRGAVVRLATVIVAREDA